MMSDLIANLKTAMEAKNDRVRECEADLEAAKEDRDSFAAQIAEELGIKAGKGGRKTTEKPAAVDPDESAGEAGEKRQRVLELFRQGKSRSETAEILGISVECVYAHISILRKHGKLGRDDETIEPDRETVGPDRETIEPEPENEVGASKESLLAEVERQQNGIRGKVVILKSTTAKSHCHTIRVDRMGDGHTVADGSGHVHRCYRFALSEAHGHTHNVTAVRPEQ